MRLLFGLVLVLGLALAGFAVWKVQGQIDQYRMAYELEVQKNAQQVPLVDVYVTTRELRFGETLKPEDVKLIKFPEAEVPPSAFREEAVLFPDNNRQPRAILRAMDPGELVLDTKVTKPGQEAGVTAFLTPGMRAFTINVDASSGVSGFVGPGDRVDVFWSGRIADRSITKLIQSNVKVIAVDQIADRDLSNPRIARTVTVEVTPSEVANLAQAQSSGRLTLALVGSRDSDTIEESIEVDQQGLLGIEETVKQQERVCTIKQRSGGTIVEVPIPCTN
jgi:pilus assembly protein CpaB